MTVSTSYAFGMTGAQIVRSAARLAGVLPAGGEPPPETLAMGLDFMNATIKALQNQGIILSTVERVTQATTAGTASYTAAADTIDIDFPAYTTPTTGSNTNALMQMHRDEYMEISDKTQQGLPTRMYVERNGAAYTLILYQVPDANVASFTYARVRLLKDMDASGATNPDLSSRWLKFLTFDLAHDFALANSLPAAKAQYLRGIAMQEREAAEGADNEGGNIQFFPSHSGGWR